MVTVVDGYTRSWSGTTFDACKYFDGDYIPEMAACPSSNFVKWVTESGDKDIAKDDNNKDESSESPSPDAKQLKQFWRLRQILTAIQRSWHKQGQIKADSLKNFPLILFSPLLDRLQPRKDHVIDTGYFTDPNLASPRTSSEAELYASLADQRQNADHLLSNPHCFIRLANPTRRHCNSESDLTWSAPNKPLPVLQQAINTSEYQTTERPNSKVTASLTQNSPENSAGGIQFDGYSVSYQDTDRIRVELPSSTEEVIVKFSAGIEEHEVTTVLSSEIYDEYIPTLETPLTCTPEESVQGIQMLVDVSTNCVLADTTLKTQLLQASEDKAKSPSPSTRCVTNSKIGKSVSFADECGQSLTEVYLIENSDQLDAFEYEAGYDGSMWTRRSRFGGSFFTGRFNRPRLKNQPTVFDPELAVTPTLNVTANPSKRLDESTRTLWVLCFPQPASQYYEFRQRVENGSISLENITLNQPDESSDTQLPQLSGTIKVKNLSYEKQVWIRLTTDHWKSFTDFVALYSPQLSGGLLHSASRFDTFTFHLNVVPQMETEEKCDKIEFAVRYLVGPDGSWGQYWDNNGGKNYVIEKRVVQSSWANQLHEISSSIQPMIKSASYSGDFSNIETSESTNSSHFHPYTQDYRPNFEGISQFTDYRAWTHFAGETTYY